MNFHTLFTVVLLLLSGVSNLVAQGYIDVLPDEVKNPFIERHGRIAKELANPVANEWAGHYTRYIGETWSEVFTWAPQNGFAVFRDTCSDGPRAWVNYGTATFRDGLFVLGPERDETAEYVLKLQDKEFMPIKWGEQHWLIPTDELALFAYAINSRSAADYEAFYIKSDDVEKARKGQPNLPPQYKRLLGLPPIKARVTKIGTTSDRWYPELTINAGKNKGVIEGISFWLVGIKDIEVKVSVSEVQDTSSTVKVIGVGILGGKDIDIVPKRGWLFTSRYAGY